MNRMKLLVAPLLVVAVAATAATGPSAAAGPRERGTIVQIAVADGQFTTLAALLKRSGLISTLRKPGPYTVFAPTDAAFRKVPKRTLRALLADKAKLRAVLLYHVVSGKVTSARITKRSSLQTVNGEKVRIRVAGTNVFVDRAKVAKPDLMASNGVIHVVDRVLVPSS